MALRQTIREEQRGTEQLKERLIQQEERSMRDNLLFMGIPESDNENTENVLHEFFEKTMPSLRHVSKFRFERVHRVGKRREANARPRPIVAKFSHFKDREFVRRNATDLRNTPFAIREQFPQEVHRCRQILLPMFKEARSKDQRPILVRDSLKIQGKVYKVNKDGRIYLQQQAGHHDSTGSKNHDHGTHHFDSDPQPPASSAPPQPNLVTQSPHEESFVPEAME